MEREYVITLQRKAKLGKAIWHKYAIVDERGGFVGYRMPSGLTGYLGPAAFDTVTERDGDYYVVVRGTLKDANRAVEDFLRNPVDRFAGRDYNPIISFIEAM